MINPITVYAVKHIKQILTIKTKELMSQLNYISNLLYNKNYNDLEPHEQHDVQNTINNPDY